VTVEAFRGLRLTLCLSPQLPLSGLQRLLLLGRSALAGLELGQDLFA
jgi:hypothetical protein